MKILKSNDIIAGWTADQWVTIFRNHTPIFSSVSDALNFRLKWLETKAQPAAYRGKDLDTELLEVAIILKDVM